MALSKVKSSMIVSMTSAKVTGALPAVSGIALTGLGGGIDTTSSSDPTLTTNPATGVGTMWANSVSGTIFICTDITTDANVWVNVGQGENDIYKHQGTISGYCAGGATSGPSSVVIDKFTFTSDQGATGVGDLETGLNGMAGAQDKTHGYIFGGNRANTIERIVFATDGNSVSVGTLTVGRNASAGHSSRTHGYNSGGETAATGDNGTSVVDKFAFQSSSNGVDIGDLISGRLSNSGVMSLTHGYTRGGRSGQPIVYKNAIERFPFASDTNAVDHGDLLSAAGNGGFNGQQSPTHGYHTGGEGSGNLTRIQKHSFESSAAATSVGTLVSTSATAGCSSTTSGYCAGAGEGTTSEILKFSFSSDGDANDIGDLTVARGNAAGLSY